MHFPETLDLKIARHRTLVICSQISRAVRKKHSFVPNFLGEDSVRYSTYRKRALHYFLYSVPEINKLLSWYNGLPKTNKWFTEARTLFVYVAKHQSSFSHVGVRKAKRVGIFSPKCRKTCM